MTIKECYEKLNGNYQDAVTRLCSDALIERFMLMFPKDGTMESLKNAVAAGDIEESFKAARTLKGLAANLSFQALAETASELTEQLRPRQNPADPALVAKTVELYQLVIDTLSAYQAEK